MKPQDLLDPASLPEDLRWISDHHALHPEDPVYLLIAWHWQRVKDSEDTLRASIVEMKAALDTRIEALTDSADAVAGLNELLANLQNELVNRPEILGQELQSQLQQPVTDAVEQLHSIQKALGPVAASFRSVRHQQILATLLVGLTIGIVASVVIFNS
jgi:hypothetical protein